MRILVLCTHNSARSQMAEGWLRRAAAEAGVQAEVWSAGTEATRVKPEAIEVMAERGIDLADHASKTLWDVPDPWRFDLVITVCDAAAESCPSSPAETARRHVPFRDPSGGPLEGWRAARDAIGAMAERCLAALAEGRVPGEAELRGTGDAAPPQSVG